MIGLIGKKIGMTQIFDEEGRQIGVTVVQVGPCYVTEVRTPEKDGYSAVQLGYGAMKEKNATRPHKVRLAKVGAPPLRWLREIRTENVTGLAAGQQLRVENFEAGDWIDVQGVSIGKGFQGVVKRHDFKGAQTMSHGTKMGREPGSVGSKAGGRGCRKKTQKGKKMPGHMGAEIVTTQNLKVVRVDDANNLLIIRGSVPGPENQCLVIRTSLKKPVTRNWKVPVTSEAATSVASEHQLSAENKSSSPEAGSEKS